MTKVFMKDGNARGLMELALLYRLIITPNPTDWAKARPEGRSPSPQAFLPEEIGVASRILHLSRACTCLVLRLYRRCLKCHALQEHDALGILKSNPNDPSEPEGYQR